MPLCMPNLSSLPSPSAITSLAPILHSFTMPNNQSILSTLTSAPVESAPYVLTQDLVAEEINGADATVLPTDDRNGEEEIHGKEIRATKLRSFIDANWDYSLMKFVQAKMPIEKATILREGRFHLPEIFFWRMSQIRFSIIKRSPNKSLLQVDSTFSLRFGSPLSRKMHWPLELPRCCRRKINFLTISFWK